VLLPKYLRSEEFLMMTITPTTMTAPMMMTAPTTLTTICRDDHD
jgi:hypothetical protein